MNFDLKKILIPDFEKKNECNSFKTKKGDDFVFIVPKSKNLVYYIININRNTS